jgi:hypothetical protein
MAVHRDESPHDVVRAVTLAPEKDENLYAAGLIEAKSNAPGICTNLYERPHVPGRL